MPHPQENTGPDFTYAIRQSPRDDIWRYEQKHDKIIRDRSLLMFDKIINVLTYKRIAFAHS
jgi:hypothetical protein